MGIVTLKPACLADSWQSTHCPCILLVVRAVEELATCRAEKAEVASRQREAEEAVADLRTKLKASEEREHTLQLEYVVAAERCKSLDQQVELLR